MSTLTNRLVSTASVTCLVVVLAADPAWAVQAHGSSEGLVAHQIGHLLLTLGMGYLLFRLNALRPKGVGWREFRVFLWLLIVWNIVTFSGHWLFETMAGEKFLKVEGNTVAFNIENIPDALFYLSNFEHTILVPAFVFLLLALRKWRLAK